MADEQPRWFGDIVRQFDEHTHAAISDSHVGQPLTYRGAIDLETGRDVGGPYEMHYQAQAIEKTTGYGKVVAVFRDAEQIKRARHQSGVVAASGRITKIAKDGFFVTVTMDDCKIG